MAPNPGRRQGKRVSLRRSDSLVGVRFAQEAFRGSEQQFGLYYDKDTIRRWFSLANCLLFVCQPAATEQILNRLTVILDIMGELYPDHASLVLYHTVVDMLVDVRVARNKELGSMLPLLDAFPAAQHSSNTSSVINRVLVDVDVLMRAGNVRGAVRYLEPRVHKLACVIAGNRICEKLIQCYCMLGEYAKAEAFAEDIQQSKRNSRRSDLNIRYHRQLNLSEIRRWQGRNEEAVDIMRHALKELERAGEDPAGATAVQRRWLLNIYLAKARASNDKDQ